MRMLTAFSRIRLRCLTATVPRCKIRNLTVPDVAWFRSSAPIPLAGGLLER
jgi:hypothetical protein